MICPMKFNLVGKPLKDGCVNITDCKCDKEECAWWYDDRGNSLYNKKGGSHNDNCGCAIKIIAEKS